LRLVFGYNKHFSLFFTGNSFNLLIFNNYFDAILKTTLKNQVNTAFFGKNSGKISR
jgi:hypothetical protein